MSNRRRRDEFTPARGLKEIAWQVACGVRLASSEAGGGTQAAEDLVGDGAGKAGVVAGGDVVA